MTRFAIGSESPSLSESFERLPDMSHPTTMEEDDSQNWELLEYATMDLPIRAKKQSVTKHKQHLENFTYTVSPGKYSIELEREMFTLEQKYIDRHSEFAVHFDEEGRFKHHNWSAATKSIIIGFLCYDEVLRGIHADDEEDTPVLQFIALVTFREEIKSIDLPDIQRMVLKELARLTNALPFPDILRVLMEKKLLWSIEIDSGLMVLLSNRLHAYAPRLPDAEITEVLWTSGGPDLEPSRIVLKTMIDLKIELQDARDAMKKIYAGSGRW
ncbi:hypothetical protein FGRMN_1424 [Fusarium graminum]|nr:hypothetical protein FGRMN_1424 [Fusarium graminum]